MSQISQVKAQVFRAGNGYEAWREGCNPLPFQGVACDYKSQGERWMVPQVVGGAVVSYEETFEDASNYTDAFKAVRLQNALDGSVIYILGTEQQWLDNCNACCGETPSMTPVTMPDPNLDEAVCCETTVTESDCVYKQYATAGTIEAGQKIQLAGFDNGVAFTPAPPAGGFATRDLALAWAQANWGAYGTFTAVGTSGIQLSSPTIKNGSFSISLLNEPYCLTITPGDKFTTVTNDGVDTDLDHEVTVVDANQVIAEISPYFAEGSLTAFSATKISYNGSGIPGGYSGTNTRTFVAGVCS